MSQILKEFIIIIMFSACGTQHSCPCHLLLTPVINIEILNIIPNNCQFQYPRYLQSSLFDNFPAISTYYWVNITKIWFYKMYLWSWIFPLHSSNFFWTQVFLNLYRFRMKFAIHFLLEPIYWRQYFICPLCFIDVTQLWMVFCFLKMENYHGCLKLSASHPYLYRWHF